MTIVDLHFLKNLIFSATKAIEKSGIKIVKTKRGEDNFVTTADLAAQTVIIELIRKKFPKDRILNEEREDQIAQPLKRRNLWVIDPIDGTRNFQKRNDYWAISILILEEAGGQALTLEGKRVTFMNNKFVAGNKTLTKEFLKKSKYDRN